MLTPFQRGWLAAQYQAHFEAVERACRRILEDPDDAADAATDVFLRAAQAVPEGLSGAATRPWLLAIARNHCIDVLRRRKVNERALAMLASVGPGGTDPEAAALDRQEVTQLLSLLPPRERVALWQNSVEQRPVNEIAGALKLNYMAAAQVLSRARRHALSMATKVAAVLLGFRLWKALRTVPAPVVATRAVALLVIPAAVIATQSGSFSRAGGGNASPATAVHAASGGGSARAASPASSGRKGSAAAGSETNITGSTPSLPGQVSHVLAPIPNPSSVTQTVGGLVPTVKITPLPTPSVALPVPTPSLPLALPTPLPTPLP
jgi:RNA polymerase sigma-70 factor (ECF subfamily)